MLLYKQFWGKKANWKENYIVIHWKPQLIGVEYQALNEIFYIQVNFFFDRKNMSANYCSPNVIYVHYSIAKGDIKKKTSKQIWDKYWGNCNQIIGNHANFYYFIGFICSANWFSRKTYLILISFFFRQQHKNITCFFVAFNWMHSI